MPLLRRESAGERDDDDLRGARPRPAHGLLRAPGSDAPPAPGAGKSAPPCWEGPDRRNSPVGDRGRTGTRLLTAPKPA